MNRLTAHACPPGGFWAELRKRKNSTHQAENSCTYDHTRHNKVNTNNGTRSNSPYLLSSLQTRIGECALKQNLLLSWFTPVTPFFLSNSSLQYAHTSCSPPNAHTPVLIPLLLIILFLFFTHYLSNYPFLPLNENLNKIKLNG